MLLLYIDAQQLYILTLMMQQYQYFYQMNLVLIMMLVMLDAHNPSNANDARIS